MAWQNVLTNIGLVGLIIFSILVFGFGQTWNGNLKFFFFIPIVLSVFTVSLVFQEEKEVRGRITGNLIPFVIVVISLGIFLWMLNK